MMAARRIEHRRGGCHDVEGVFIASETVLFRITSRTLGELHLFMDKIGLDIVAVKSRVPGWRRFKAQSGEVFCYAEPGSFCVSEEDSSRQRQGAVGTLL